MKKPILVACVVPLLAASRISQTPPADSNPVMQGSMSYTMPKSAIDAKIDGTVLLAIRIDDTGKPTNVRVASLPMWPCSDDPRDALNDVFKSLEDTMKKARFSPASKDGKAVAKEIGFRIELKNPKLDLKVVEIDPVTKKPTSKQIIGDIVFGKAISRPGPVWPKEARAVREVGMITVKIVIDEQGNVIRAGTLDGPATMQFTSRTAACKAKFSPTTLDGNPIKVTVVLTYTLLRSNL